MAYGLKQGTSQIRDASKWVELTINLQEVASTKARAREDAIQLQSHLIALGFEDGGWEDYKE